MHVLVQRQHRLLRRERRELIEKCLQGPPLLHLRRQVERRIALPARHTEQGGEQRHDLVQPVARAREHRLEPGQLHVCRRRALEPRRPLQKVDHRIQRAVGVMRRAVVAERRVRLVAQAPAQGPEQARLADPGLAREQHHLAVAIPGPGPALQQDAELVLAPDQRGEMLAVQRVEPALRAALAFDPESRERRGEALERHRPQIGQLEQAADQPARRLADHHTARRGKSLESGREVRRLADHRLLLGRALADQLADHDQAGRDADARGERQSFLAPAAQGQPGRVQGAHGLDQFQPGPDRPLGLVLVRPGPAEVGEHAVAHVFGDVAAPALDHLGAGAVIGPDQGTHVLGIEPRRKRGRADEIDEQHGQLPPLRLGGGRSHVRVPIGDRAGLGPSQLPNRLQQLDAMAERQAELLQMLIAQLEQRLAVDGVAGEQLGILAEALGLQPCGHI